MKPLNSEMRRRLDRARLRTLDPAWEYARMPNRNLRAAGAVGGLLIVMLVLTVLLGA